MSNTSINRQRDWIPRLPLRDRINKGIPIKIVSYNILAESNIEITQNIQRMDKYSRWETRRAPMIEK